jgi:predicted  nucleic acid-binding Zn-ribbon protein
MVALVCDRPASAQENVGKHMLVVYDFIYSGGEKFAILNLCKRSNADPFEPSASVKFLLVSGGSLMTDDKSGMEYMQRAITGFFSNTKELQSRIGEKPDGDWGLRTWASLLKFLRTEHGQYLDSQKRVVVINVAELPKLEGGIFQKVKNRRSSDKILPIGKIVEVFPQELKKKMGLFEEVEPEREVTEEPVTNALIREIQSQMTFLINGIETKVTKANDALRATADRLKTIEQKLGEGGKKANGTRFGMTLLSLLALVNLCIIFVLFRVWAADRRRKGALIKHEEALFEEIDGLESKLSGLQTVADKLSVYVDRLQKIEGQPSNGTKETIEELTAVREGLNSLDGSLVQILQLDGMDETKGSENVTEFVQKLTEVLLALTSLKEKLGLYQANTPEAASQTSRPLIATLNSLKRLEERLSAIIRRLNTIGETDTTQGLLKPSKELIEFQSNVKSLEGMISKYIEEMKASQLDISKKSAVSSPELSQLINEIKTIKAERRPTPDAVSKVVHEMKALRDQISLFADRFKDSVRVRLSDEIESRMNQSFDNISHTMKRGMENIEQQLKRSLTMEEDNRRAVSQILSRVDHITKILGDREAKIEKEKPPEHGRKEGQNGGQPMT